MPRSASSGRTSPSRAAARTTPTGIAADTSPIKGKQAALASARAGLFALGSAPPLKLNFKTDFASEANFLKTPLAKSLQAFKAQSSNALALARQPLVLVRLTDGAANPQPGQRLELLDGNAVFLDAVQSDSIGLGLLRWPTQAPASGAPRSSGPPLVGKVRVAGNQLHDVTIPAGEDFVVVHLTFGGAAVAAPGNAAADSARHDSVIPRLPAFFSVKAADEIARYRDTADGPDPCFASAMDRQCTYRAPRVRWIYTRRTVYDPNGLKPPRRLYVRLRQEWHFVGHSFGQPERIDSRDVATLVGSLDANLDARLAVTGRFDASTESVLTADARGGLRAAASLDGELDASVGLHLFEGGLGNPLSVSGDADVSVDTSLLVSAQLKLRASLRNQLHARASLNGRASVGLEAQASVGVNPSLARELNLPRFVVHQNYLVVSHVEDVQQLQEVELFDDPTENNLILPPRLPFLPFPLNRSPLFPPSDIVEYRPIFERQLLEPQLAPRFRALRNALDAAAGRGPSVRRLRFEVNYSATTSGWISARVLGRSVTGRVRPGQSQMSLAIDLPGGQFLDTLNNENAGFGLTLDLTGLLAGSSASIQVSNISVFSDASAEPQRHAVAAQSFGVTLANPVASEDINLTLPSSDTGLHEDPLVIHINRNRTYYMGLLVKAAVANPSLRFDVPQLRSIGPDSVLWRIPIHGFAGNKALILTPAEGPKVADILADLGRATVIQLAVDGHWSEAMQSKNAIVDALGQLFPALASLQLPLALLEGLQSGAGLASAIVETGGQAAGAAGAVAGAVTGVAGGLLGGVADVLDV